MSRPRLTSRALTRGFPRVSGDEPTVYEYIKKAAWFSPRERG